MPCFQKIGNAGTLLLQSEKRQRLYTVVYIERKGNAHNMLLLGEKTTLIICCFYQEKRQRLFGVTYIKRIGNAWVPLSQRLATSIAFCHKQATLRKCCDEQRSLFPQKALPQRKDNSSLGHLPKSVSLGAKSMAFDQRQQFLDVQATLEKCCLRPKILQWAIKFAHKLLHMINDNEHHNPKSSNQL